VDGKKIPEVDFDAGDSWAGLLPISSDPNETRKVRRCIYSCMTMLNPPSYFFGTILRQRRETKTISYSGKHIPVTVRVRANTNHTLGRTADQVAHL